MLPLCSVLLLSNCCFLAESSPAWQGHPMGVHATGRGEAELLPQTPLVMLWAGSAALSRLAAAPEAPFSVSSVLYHAQELLSWM